MRWSACNTKCYAGLTMESDDNRGDSNGIEVLGITRHPHLRALPIKRADGPCSARFEDVYVIGRG